jgi:hypothetical protein
MEDDSSDDMATNISELNTMSNFARQMEQEIEKKKYYEPEERMRPLPPTRQVAFPYQYQQPMMEKKKKKKKKHRENGEILEGLIARFKNPTLIAILFIILANKRVVRTIDSFLPLGEENPNSNMISLCLRGLICGISFTLLKKWLK